MAGGVPWEMQREHRADRDLLVLALVVVACGLLFDVTPARDGVSVLGHRLPESCGVRRLTGDGCPGCGLTRSVILSLRGSAEAFALHPLGPLFLLVLLTQIPYRGWRMLRRRRLIAEGLVDLTLTRGVTAPRFRNALVLSLVLVWIL